MKVHFGAGEHAHLFVGWTCVDLHPHPNVSIIADLLDGIPEEIEDVETAYVGHLLEHLTPDEARGFLGQVRSRMADGGRLVVVGPDVEKGEHAYQAGEIWLELRQRIGKWGEPNPDDYHDRSECHMWDCTGHAVVSLAEEAGWTGVNEHTIAPWPLPDVPCISEATWQFLVTGFTYSE